MKKFNKVITVEVEVDSIAQQLLESFKDDFKHAEITTEAIIGNLLAKDRLSDLYNSLNGWTTDLDFEVNDVVDCTKSIYDYLEGGNSSKSRPIGLCIVTHVDKYADYPITVEYQYVQEDGKVVTKTTTCSKSYIKGSEFMCIPELSQKVQPSITEEG